VARRLSVCLSHAGIVSKRLNIPSNFFTVGQPHHSSFSTPNVMVTFQRVPPHALLKSEYDLEWFSEIFTDMKHRAASLRRLSFLSTTSVKAMVKWTIWSEKREWTRRTWRLCHRLCVHHPPHLASSRADQRQHYFAWRTGCDLALWWLFRPWISALYKCSNLLTYLLVCVCANVPCRCLSEDNQTASIVDNLSREDEGMYRCVAYGHDGDVIHNEVKLVVQGQNS